MLSDLLGSVGAMIAAIVILTTGWTPIDPILSVLVSVLILRSAWRLLKKVFTNYWRVRRKRLISTSCVKTYVPIFMKSGTFIMFTYGKWVNNG